MFTMKQPLARLLACKFLWVLVARNHLCVSALGYHLLNLHWTFLWAWIMAHTWALVSQIT